MRHPSLPLRLVLASAALSCLFATLAPRPALAADPVPKVVLVVGPVGDLTSRYIALADAAASAARSAGADVVKVYSPNATWPAVREAANDASILVYLGHGNGWPSRYRDHLYPPTQNGFGLNPLAGEGHRAHQYFGEASVERLRLAPNAVVILSHLCYASGNSEPGLPEGGRRTAIARVDNYAAGFIRAGASAVVAEGHLGPAYYVRALLESHRTVEQIWDTAPSSQGHAFALASQRSPGFTDRLDPDHRNGGYYRSLVSAGVSAADVRAGARGTTEGQVSGIAPDAPSLAGLGVRFGTPALRGRPIAGDTGEFMLPMPKGRGSRLPAGIAMGALWIPIVLEGIPIEETTSASQDAAEPAPTAEPPTGEVPDEPAATDDPATTAEPAPTAEPPTGEVPDEPAATDDPATQDSAATSGPAATDGLQAGHPEPPAIVLVAPEDPGTVLDPVPASVSRREISFVLTYPEAPGLYRLEVTLHDPGGVAYDHATQALVVPLIVHVVGPVSAVLAAPAWISVAAGDPVEFSVRVLNSGAEPWGAAPPVSAAVDDVAAWARAFATPPRMTGTWVSIEGHDVPDPGEVVLDGPAAAPGASAVLPIRLLAPRDPGPYLVLLDVVSPRWGPISALGSDPAIVRALVTPSAGQSNAEEGPAPPGGAPD